MRARTVGIEEKNGNDLVKWSPEVIIRSNKDNTLSVVARRNGSLKS